MGLSFTRYVPKRVTSQQPALCVPDAWIDEAVRDVHEQIENQNGDGNERDDADNQRLVAIETGVDEIIAKSRNRKPLLDHYPPPNQQNNTPPSNQNHLHH